MIDFFPQSNFEENPSAFSGWLWFPTEYSFMTDASNTRHRKRSSQCMWSKHNINRNTSQENQPSRSLIRFLSSVMRQEDKKRKDPSSIPLVIQLITARRYILRDHSLFKIQISYMSYYSWPYLSPAPNFANFHIFPHPNEPDHRKANPPLHHRRIHNNGKGAEIIRRMKDINVNPGSTYASWPAHVTRRRWWLSIIIAHRHSSIHRGLGNYRGGWVALTTNYSWVPSFLSL